MAMAFRYSQAQGLCPQEDVALAEQAIAAAGLAHLPRLLPGGPWRAEVLFEAMSHDKKNENGALTLILTRGIGAAFVQKGVDAEAVRAFLKEDVQK
jgi:3-dehydroquinate synthetase